MKSSSLLKALFLFAASFLFVSESLAVYPATCPVMQKRNNGNGLWGSCAGQGGVPVATNVAPTPYANFFTTYGIVPSTKTGDINFYWPGVTNITELYVITRVWVGTTILPTRVGPPPVPEIRNGNTYATYCFYVANLPNAGILTLEFTNPVTNQPAYLCAYDLKSGATVTPAVSCAPTINTQPQNKVVCTDTTSFRIDASGVSSYQWQISSNGTTWNNITGAPFTGFTTSVLNIGASASTYNNYQFRVVLTGAGSCGTTTSSVATLTAYPKPTATFAAGAIVCGVGTYNLRINFTGTGPWSFTYTTNGGSATTVSNIATSPYYLPVSPTATTTYAITALNDRYCANYSVSAPVTIVVQDKPTITVTSPVYYCYSNTMGTATLSYTATTNSPTQYSITPGTRSMGGFSNVLNASNTFNSGSGTLGISIPASIAAGTYDFNIRVKVASPGSGCESVDVPFTIIIRPAPSIVASSSASSVCLNGSVTLSASPDLSSSGFTYAWTGATVASPSAVSTSATVTADPSTYTVTVTQPGTGCTASSSVTVTLKAGASISVNNATICSGDRAVLTASGGVTYSWSLSPSGSASATLSSTTGSTVLANPTTTTTYRVTGTSSTGCAGFADATVTVNSGLNVTVTSSASICPGGSINLTASGATNYSWAPTTSLSASTGATVTATPSSTTTYTVTGTTGSCSGSASTTVTVNTPPVTSFPARQLYHCGSLFNGNDYFTLTVTTSSNVTVIWQTNATSPATWTDVTATASSSGIWRSNAVGTSGQSFSLFVKDNGNTITQYRAGVISGTCTTYYYTDLVDLNIVGPVFSAITSQYLCNGGTPSVLSINGSFTNGTGTATTPSYQWQVSTDSINFSDIVGATATTYQPGALSASRWYRFGIKTSSGTTDCQSMDYSSLVRVIVGANISNNVITATNCTSGVPSITQSGTLSGGTGSYTYMWESSTNGSTWTTIPGATSQNYTGTATLIQKTWYRRTVTSGNCSDLSASLELTPAILNNEISTGQNVCFGSSVSTLGPVSPTGGTGSYTYQWESSATGSSWGAEAGATSSSFSPSAAVGAKYYRVVVTSGSCASISNQSYINVNALPTISTSGGNVSVCQGLSTTLTATGAVSYTWSPSTDLNVAAGEKVISTPTATRTYTITGTDANGCTNTGSVTVTLNTLPTAPISNGTTTSNQCYSGSVPSINLNTTFISGTVSSPLEYQWFTESTNPPVSAPVSNPTTSAGTYYAFTKNTTTGCFSSTSITATLNFINNAAPVPLTSSFTACDPATYNLLSAEPTAPSGTTWEWQTSSTYNTANAVGTPTAVSSGTYYLYGRNSTCTTASAQVTVTINPIPVSVSMTVPNESACAPNKVNITNNYSGSPGYIYQWYTVNSNPSPATMITDPSAVDAGTYYLFITDETTLCQNTSPSSVAVTINPKPVLTITSPTLSCEGSSVSIVGSSNLAANYQWYTVNTTTNTATALTNSSPYSNVTTNTLSVNPTTGLSSNLFYFTATSTTGSCLSTSDMVPIPLQTNVSCATQPSSKFVGSLPGGTFFDFTVDDFNAEIQWQVSTNGGSSWRNILGTGGNNATLYYGYNTIRLDLLTVHDSMNNFQYRAIASTSPCPTGCTTSIATLTTPISLPVSGMKLVGAKAGQQLELKWFVLSEEEVQYYQVEYAENGRDFVSLGRVFVATPSITARSYTYLVPLKKGYYRIQAASELHSTVYSNLYWYNAIHVIKTGINPNPVQAEKGIMQLSVSGVDHEIPFKVNVHGVDGRLIQSADMMMQTGIHAFRLSDNALSGSIVILSIVHPDLGVIERRKVVIQH